MKTQTKLKLALAGLSVAGALVNPPALHAIKGCWWNPNCGPLVCADNRGTDLWTLTCSGNFLTFAYQCDC
jgi:hypothetical protein